MGSSFDDDEAPDFEHAPPTEADNPVVDVEAWEDNPFAAGNGSAGVASGGAGSEADRLILPGDEPPEQQPVQQQPVQQQPVQQQPVQQQPVQQQPVQQQPVQQQSSAPSIVSAQTPQVRSAGSGQGQGPTSQEQPWAPQIPLPDVDKYKQAQSGFGGAAPPPGYGESPPPGYGEKASGPTSSISYTIDVVLKALEPGKKRKRTIIIAAIVLIAAGAAAAIWIGSSNVGEKIEKETEDEVVPEMAPPEWEPVATVPVQIRTEPAGARLVVNAVATDATSPGVVELPADAPSTITAFADGHFPATAQVESGGAAANEGVSLTLQPVGDAPLGWLKIKVHKEDIGAKVKVDGKAAGEAPVIVEDLALGAFHHIQVEREGKAPWVGIRWLDASRAEFTAPELATGVYVDRKAELDLQVAPPQATVEIDGVEKPAGRAVYDKGEIVTIEATLPGRTRFRQSIHTTPIGSFDIDARLVPANTGKAKVRWRTRNDDLRPCLVRPGQGFCWREDPEDYLVVNEGTWTLKVYELVDGRKVYADDEPTIKFEPNRRYKVKLRVDEGDVELDIGRSRDWTPDDE